MLHVAVAMLCSYIRDHVLWFFVEHLDTGEHHTTTNLFVQVSQDVVKSFSHLGVVQGHACGGHRHKVRDCIQMRLSCMPTDTRTHTHTHTHTHRPISLASSSVSVLLRYVFFFFREFPEGRVAPVLGIGGSPSFCCRASAITRNARRPMFIRWNTGKASLLYARHLSEAMASVWQGLSLAANHEAVLTL